MGQPARKDEGEEMLTAEELSGILRISRTSAYDLIARIPFHVRIGVGKRQQLRLPRQAFERWQKAGGDRWQRSDDSPIAHTSTLRDAIVTANAGAKAPSKPAKTQPQESPAGSNWKEQFPGYNPSRSRKRSSVSRTTRKEKT